jgi:hypothetical protein
VSKKYNDSRDTIQNGDIILYRGSSLMAHSIQYLDKAYYNHVGVVWKVEDPDTKEYRLLTMDMWTKGLCLVPLSERMSEYDDFCIIRPVVKDAVTDSAIFSSLKQWEGKIGYDYMLLLRIALIKKMGVDISNLGKSDKYICSEFAQYYCSLLNITTYDNIKLITPEDFRRFIDSNFNIMLDDAPSVKYHNTKKVWSLKGTYNI